MLSNFIHVYIELSFDLAHMSWTIFEKQNICIITVLCNSYTNI